MVLQVGHFHGARGLKFATSCFSGTGEIQCPPGASPWVYPIDAVIRYGPQFPRKKATSPSHLVVVLGETHGLLFVS